MWLIVGRFIFVPRSPAASRMVYLRHLYYLVPCGSGIDICEASLEGALKEGPRTDLGSFPNEHVICFGERQKVYPSIGGFLEFLHSEPDSSKLFPESPAQRPGPLNGGILVINSKKPAPSAEIPRSPQRPDQSIICIYVYISESRI